MGRKTLLYFLVLLMAINFSSCLNFNDEPEPAATEKEELALLDEYLKALEGQGTDIDTTELGIYYITIKEGEGDYPQPGDTLEVGYAGYFIDNTLFDATNMYDENGTYTFVYGNPPMIKGWDDGMKVINKNAKVQLIIPSKFAYGSEGSGTIPPFKTLIFVIEMKDIKPSE